MKNGEIISVNKLNLKNNRKFDIEVKGPHVYFADGILVHNCKLDGMYANGNILDDLQFVSRQGSVMPMEHFKAIADSVKDINGYQTHGELLVKQDGKILPRTTSNGILTSLLSIKYNQDKLEKLKEQLCVLKNQLANLKNQE